MNPHSQAQEHSPFLLPEVLDLPVRRLTVADLAACSDLAESRGWRREEHKWRLLLTAGTGYGIDAPDQPGSLIGTFVLTSYASLAGAAAPAPARGCTAISMVLVAERFERRGLGRRMMRHAIAECGDTIPFLTATENGRPLYEEFGFAAVGSLTILTGHLTSTRTDGQSGPAVPVRPATAADMPGVRALDAPAFGADRTELLVRLPAFSDRFVVAEGPAGALAGFAASWPNTRSTVVGPVIAQDLGTAKALIADLGSHAPGELRFDADARHPGLETWLRAHGLTGGHVCTLMVRDAPGLPGDADLRFAPYSVALG